MAMEILDQKAECQQDPDQDDEEEAPEDSAEYETVLISSAGDVVAAIANVSANATILFEKGVTYNIFTPITFPTFTNVEVSIQGNLTYPANITAVQGKLVHCKGMKPRADENEQMRSRPR